MRYELIVAWMDALIEEWKRAYMLRTLSTPCGAEYATWIDLNSDMSFQLDFEGGRDSFESLAAYLNARVEQKDFMNYRDHLSFKYKGFEFFYLTDRKETE